MKAHLILRDGRHWRGRTPLGLEGLGGSGEVVFSTAMGGYQEILTDPSFAGQMVCLTFPEQGIYGLHGDLDQAPRPWAAALICRRLTLVPDRPSGQGDLGGWLRRHRVPVITDLDTRSLVHHLRDAGAQPGLIWTEADGGLEEGLARAAALPAADSRALVSQVSCRERREMPRQDARFRVAVLDGGVKASILAQLQAAGLHLEVFPWDTPARELTAPRFHGLFLSNGPGDPGALPGMQRVVAECVGRLPIFGICLGHQLLAHALGGRTFKLPFGHRGANQPVLDLASSTVQITAQNHGYAVDEASLPADLEVTHRHLSDGTVEGLRHRGLPIFSLQHHPEACPGPHDARGAFGRFVSLMEAAHAPA